MTSAERVLGRRSRRAMIATILVLAVFALLWTSLRFGETALESGSLWDPSARDALKLARRAQRAVAAAIIGAALAVAGVVFQALIRNPLASPYVLGVSAGGSLGSVLALLSGFSTTTPAAFLGSIGAVALVYGVASRRGRLPANSLLLAGVIVNALFAALIMLLNLLAAPHDQARILRWLVGGLRDHYETETLFAAGATVLALGGIATCLGRHLDLLALGDVVAERTGVPVARTRSVLFALASLATAIAVSISGPIGFVGLIVPHAARAWVGPAHRRLVPAAVFGGSIFLVAVDLVARTVFEFPLPVGVVTAFLGGPAFLWMLSRTERGMAGDD